MLIVIGAPTPIIDNIFVKLYSRTAFFTSIQSAFINHYKPCFCFDLSLSVLVKCMRLATNSDLPSLTICIDPKLPLFNILFFSWLINSSILSIFTVTLNKPTYTWYVMIEAPLSTSTTTRKGSVKGKCYDLGIVDWGLTRVMLYLLMVALLTFNALSASYATSLINSW
jgi:hypothetical protein